jgi:hypothetical protein
MKSESLNGVLTFVLGVFVVLGVFFSLKVAFATHETRTLQNEALQDNARLIWAKSLVADVQAYNQRYPSVELTHLLQSLQAKPAPATH